ncbi:hypothetical protein EVG20_g594 [Dentipellis fragilis]|uniref:Uncharacterized protein n=1 Tax=Dentipellis fragilis TaxID=205917 RepID=A0A4Y9ZC60_9AGAM|nr:hypothetical protein EVG20_g594 [Dentipellis fragilis]
MDTTWSNQFFGLEPFEESWQGSTTSSTHSSDATVLATIMETKETPKHGRKKSIFSRKSKRANTAPAHLDDMSDKTRDADAGSLTTLESVDNFGMPTTRSIIPDPLNELPAWFNKEGEWAASPVHLFRSRYPIHNPVGPRYYRNIHLLPHVLGKRPSSVFSPSFPPMAAEGASDDPAWKPSPSRSPSGSPLPTPSSSQTRIPDDRAVTSPDETDKGPQSRMASFNGGPRHKTTTPSPLSQSTSAIHLQAAEFEAAQLSRKLSRKLSKRKPGIRSVFGGKTEDTHDVQVSASAPVTPIDPTATVVSSDSSHPKTLGRKHSKMASGVPPTASQVSIPASISTHSVAPSKKKEKRGSVLGRLAKRFSVMRKSTRHSLAVTDEGHDPSSRQGSVEPERRTSSLAPRIPSPEKPPHSRQSTDASKRVPPPVVDTATSPDVATPPPVHPDNEIEDRKSSISLETPFSIGRLTIANPDSPSSSDNSPARPPVQLPPHEIASPLSRTISRPSDDKALPIITPVSEGHLHRQLNGLVSSPVEMNSPALTPIEKDSPSVPPKSPIRRSSEKHLPSSHQPSSSRGSSEIQPSSAAMKSPSRRSLDQHVSSPRHSRQGSSTGKSSSDARQGSSSTKHSTLHSPDRQPSSHPQPHNGSSSMKPVNGPTVPFPKASHQSPSAAPAIVQAIASSSSADDSPLSKASILANPPTPHVPPVDMRSPVPVIPSPIIITPSGATTTNGTRSSRESSPTKKESSSRIMTSSSVKSRETETFRLIRSPSTGQVPTTGQTFVAHGEHWEVVGSPEPAKRSKTLKEEPKPKKLTKRESKRHEKEKAKEAVTNGHTRAASMDSLYQQAPPQSQLSKHVSKTKESSSKKRKSHSEHRANGHRTSVDTATGKVQTTAADNGGAHLERHPSTSARPTSEMPSAADLNAFRARDAWEMDRLWKGRSMAYGLDGPQVVYTQSIGSNPSVGDVRRSSTVGPGGHGSSHTSYKLQTPFHGHESSAQTHTHIPSHDYSPHSHSPDYTAPAPSYLYPNGYRSYPDISTIPSMSSPADPPQPSLRYLTPYPTPRAAPPTKPRPYRRRWPTTRTQPSTGAASLASFLRLTDTTTSRLPPLQPTTPATFAFSHRQRDILRT